MAQWSRPVPIPNQTSKTTSALALIQGQLHLIHLGESSDNLWHSVWNGTRWSDNVRTRNQSSGRVALANEGLMVYQNVERESDGSRGLLYSLFEGAWTLSRPVPDRVTTDDAPAGSLGLGGWTFVRQVPHRDYQLASTTYVRAPGGGISKADGGLMTQYSAKVPALASDRAGASMMIYTYKGSKDLWYSSAGGERQIPNQSTRDSPAAAIHNGVPHMTHIGSGSDTIWHSTFVNGGWTPNVPIPDHFSNKPPAMCSAPDGLHMVHKGAGSDRIWHSIYR
ncbi:MAG TPA: hypothetical protein VGB98_09635 [Pyrinomonadaceae bacterium]|jgi:hypothetical protein